MNFPENNPNPQMQHDFVNLRFALLQNKCFLYTFIPESLIQ
jgi:hypothetical protein